MHQIDIVQRSNHQGKYRYHIQSQVRGQWGTNYCQKDLDAAKDKAYRLQKYYPVRIVDYGER